MFRLATRATGKPCLSQLSSQTFVRGVRTRAVPKQAKVAPRGAPKSVPSTSQQPKPKPAKASKASKFVIQAVPLPREPVYIELSHLLPPPDGEQPKPQVVALSPDVFHQPIRRDILHLCVVHHLDCLRQGSANTKTRGEVRGSGRKIRPQKGTGKARLGDGQSPMLKGGGVAFGPRPRDFSTKLPRKVRAMGMRIALSARVKERSFAVVESLRWPGVKTAEFKRRVEELSWGPCLFVTGCGDEVVARLNRVSNNLKGFHTIKVEDLNVHEILRWDRLVVDVEAAEYMETRYHPSVFFKAPVPFALPPLGPGSESLKLSSTVASI